MKEISEDWSFWTLTELENYFKTDEEHLWGVIYDLNIPETEKEDLHHLGTDVSQRLLHYFKTTPVGQTCAEYLKLDENVFLLF